MGLLRKVELFLLSCSEGKFLLLYYKYGLLKGIIVLFIDIFLRRYNQIYWGGLSISFSIIVAIKLRNERNKKKKKKNHKEYEKNHVLKTFQKTQHSSSSWCIDTTHVQLA